MTHCQIDLMGTTYAPVPFLRPELTMVTRDQRLAEFNTQGTPQPAEAVQVLCEDKSGTYLLPFACVHADGQWRNARTGHIVEAQVIGWRQPRGE
jgi:hypothetical protein